MKVAGETWQRSRRTSPAAGSYIQPCINCGKTGESFVFKESKSKSFKELIKSLTPAGDNSESDDDFALG